MKLSELERDQEILFINFNGYDIYQIGYTKITFTKDNRPGWQGGQHFSTTSPPGCSSWLWDEQLEKHYFLSDFDSHMYFFTLKPEQWKEDLKKELKFLIKRRKQFFNRDMNKIKNKINYLILSNKTNDLTNIKPKKYSEPEVYRIMRKIKLNKIK